MNQNPEPIANYISLIQTYIPKMISGDFAEFGCFNGGHVASLAKLDGRTTWAFDTFGGMPKEDYIESLDSCNPPGKFAPQHDVVQFLDNIPNIKVMEGRFVDTLPLIPKDVIFALVYLDCDYYESHKQVLDYLKTYGHVRPGTVLVFDDYNHLPGAQKAIDEWRANLQFEDENNKVIIYRA